MGTMKKSRAFSFLVILVVYVLAAFVGIWVFRLMPTGNDVLNLFAADAAATVFVWIFSMLFKNSSIYDPYWSVAPLVILPLLAYHYGAFDMPTILMLAGVGVWGIRLTVNWAVTFDDLTIQDWRYDKLKNESNKYLWPLVSFMSVHFIPTVVVFLAMIPAFKLMTLHADANVFTYVAFALTLIAAGLQFFSDRQAHAFRKANPGKVCNTGLWKYSRHPNYLGEVTMWWGVYFILLSVAPSLWWTGIGAVANTCLFAFISIPMMEKRQLANKPGYAEYVKNTSRLLLCPPRNK